MSDSPVTPAVPKPLLSGTAATVVGAIAVGISALVGILPPPWGGLAGVVGLILAALAGAAAPALPATDGKPILQGVALTIAAGAGAVLEQFWSSIPEGWPQSVAFGLAAVLAWLTGKSLPQLGNPNVKAAEAAGRDAVLQVRDVMTKTAKLHTLESLPSLPAVEQDPEQK